MADPKRFKFENSEFYLKSPAQMREIFKDFKQAFAFMKNCYEPIEQMNHHPDWSNVYSTVNVTLNTHDSGGITHKDILLAKAMNQVFEDLMI
jgi:4a-hydroxytetrahydrobiopterin dehydratase